MASGDSHDRPLSRHPLVLELVISEADPLTGLVGPASSTDRISFRGWIDLMSVIGTLFAGHAENPPAS